MGDKSDVIVNILEFSALLFMGIIAVLFFTHLLNGTLGSWIKAKFHAEIGTTPAITDTVTNTTTEAGGTRIQHTGQGGQ